MPIIQRPYVPPEDQVPNEDSYVNPGVSQSEGTGEAAAAQEGSLDPITCRPSLGGPPSRG